MTLTPPIKISSVRSGRLVKSFEGDAPFLVLQVSYWRPATTAQTALDRKFFVVLNAVQQHMGVRLLNDKPEALKPQGAFVSSVRKHCPTAGFGGIFQSPSGDFWVPLFTTKAAEQASFTADFYVQLAKETPPELRFFAADGTVLMRRSNAGVYTKRKSWNELKPSLEEWPPDFSKMKEIPVALPADDTADQGEPTTLETPRPELTLPDFQRLGRDKLTRRLKTLRRALAKAESEWPSLQKIADAEQVAVLLKHYLHLVRPGQIELVLDSAQTGGAAQCLALDPERSAGQNLEDQFKSIKKLKKAREIGEQRLINLRQEVDELTQALTELRTHVQTLTTVSQILRRFKLGSEKNPQGHPVQSNQAIHAAAAVAKLYKTYKIGARADVVCHVGKSASDNDALTKSAKANDYWLHAVGCSGSHVIIPARALRQIQGNSKQADLDPQLLREAAILALHYSKRRDDYGGEVYVTRRQHLRKRKGMAVGAWQVEKSATVFVRYDMRELKAVLDKLREHD